MKQMKMAIKREEENIEKGLLCCFFLFFLVFSRGNAFWLSSRTTNLMSCEDTVHQVSIPKTS